MAKMTDEAKVLVVGGPSAYRELGRGSAQRLPFTFSGLARAYEVLPDTDTVVLLPDRYDTAQLPSPEDICRIVEPIGCPPLVLELGIPVHQQNVPLATQVREALDALPPEEVPDFTRRAMAAAVKHVLKQTFNVVHGGGTVYLLLPEDLTAWAVDDRADICDHLPGIHVGADATWASRVSGNFAWMVREWRSSLWFGFSDEYEEQLAGHGYIDVPDPLPFPDHVLGLLPTEVVVSVGSGAVDRSGRHRVLVLQWGKGHFVIGPAMARGAVLEGQGIEDHDDEEGVGSGQQQAGPLAGRLPADADALAKWNASVGWGRPDRRRGAIQSLRVLALTLDTIKEEAQPSDTTVPVAGVDGNEISGEAIRQLINRRKRRRGLPAPVAAFLEAAQNHWRRYFRHT